MNVVNSQVFSRAAIGAGISVPNKYVFSPHTLSIASAEGEEIVHEASGAVHRWLIVKGVYFLVERPFFPLRARLRRDDSEVNRPLFVWDASLPRPLAVLTIPFFLRQA